MPGTLVGTINWKSSFNSQKDGDELCVTMKNTWEKRYGGLTIFFLAEKHRDPFDGERSKIVFDDSRSRNIPKGPVSRWSAAFFKAPRFRTSSSRA